MAKFKYKPGPDWQKKSVNLKGDKQKRATSVVTYDTETWPTPQLTAADQLYIESGILSPREVEDSRWRNRYQQQPSPRELAREVGDWLSLGAICAGHRFDGNELSLDDWTRQVPAYWQGMIQEVFVIVSDKYYGQKLDTQLVDTILIEVYEETRMRYENAIRYQNEYRFSSWSWYNQRTSYSNPFREAAARLEAEIARQVAELMPDTATNWDNWLWGELPEEKAAREFREKLSGTIQMAKSVIDAWVSDVVDDTMRRAAVLDFAPSLKVEHKDEPEPFPIEL